MSKNLILIFTRNPELGKCKTRLAKTVGNENALTIYKMLLEHTEKVVRNIDANKAVYYSVKIRENDLWDANIYQKHQQKGTNLGLRMQHAFKQSFNAGYKNVLIVGSDLYDLHPKHITEAFKKLDSNDVVLGPAEDGGYYLLGMKKLHPHIFENKQWGTETVRADTLSDLQNQKVAQLETLNDIDVFEDIKKYDIFKPYFSENYD